jgi:peptidoglycan/xylan/chitin deacetylase (PgdA/CDA1 family)
MTLLTAEGIRIDIREAEARIADATGRDPRPWFRCPFGDGSDSPDVLATLAEAGYREVGWNVDSNDWCARTPGEVHTAVVNGALSREDTAVVLFHTWPIVAADVLGAILEDLRAAGTSFLTIPQLAPQR